MAQTQILMTLHEIEFRPGLPQTPLGELTALPIIPSWFKGEGRERKGREKQWRKGKWKGRSGAESGGGEVKLGAAVWLRPVPSTLTCFVNVGTADAAIILRAK